MAGRFKVNINTVKRIVYRYRETGKKVERYFHRVGRRGLIDESGKETLRRLIKESPEKLIKNVMESPVNKIV